MWVRGLKHQYVFVVYTDLYVAPYVGAWIETVHSHAETLKHGVAPYVGAWIETPVCNSVNSKTFSSHPMWVRGLKLPFFPYISFHFVAPYVGAWIETPTMKPPNMTHSSSHPMWVRGLKHKMRGTHILAYNRRTLCGCVD